MGATAARRMQHAIVPRHTVMRLQRPFYHCSSQRPHIIPRGQDSRSQDNLTSRWAYRAPHDTSKLFTCFLKTFIDTADKQSFHIFPFHAVNHVSLVSCLGGMSFCMPKTVQKFIAMQEAITSGSLEYLGPRKAGTC